MILYVTWKDAASIDAWTPKEDIRPELSTIETVGMLIDEDDETLVLGLNHDIDSNSWSCLINIPKKLITLRSELYLAKSCQCPYELD